MFKENNYIQEDKKNIILIENEKLQVIKNEIKELQVLILEDKIDRIKLYISSLDFETKKYFAENDLFIEYLYDNSNIEIKKILIKQRYNLSSIIDKKSLTSEMAIFIIKELGIKEFENLMVLYKVEYSNFSVDLLVEAQKQGKVFNNDTIRLNEKLLLNYMERKVLTDSEIQYFYDNCKYISCQLFIFKNYKISLKEQEFIRLKQIEPSIVEFCLKNKSNFGNLLSIYSKNLGILKSLYDYEVGKKESLKKEIINIGTLDAIKFLIDKGDVDTILEAIKTFKIKEDVLNRITEITTNILIIDELKKSKVKSAIKSADESAFVLADNKTKVAQI